VVAQRKTHSVLVGSFTTRRALTVATLERGGHDVMRISRSLGVDLSTGAGLDDALAGVEAVVDVTGPEAQDLVDMARRTNEARGRVVKLVPTWSSVFGLAMAGNVLLPGEGARIAPTTFDEWLTSERANS
jgi:hypothetical protein